MVSIAHLVPARSPACACCRARPPLAVLRSHPLQPVAPALVPAAAPWARHAVSAALLPPQGLLQWTLWGPRRQHSPWHQSEMTPGRAPPPLEHSRALADRPPQRLHRQERVFLPNLRSHGKKTLGLKAAAAGRLNRSSACFATHAPRSHQIQSPTRMFLQHLVPLCRSPHT